MSGDQANHRVHRRIGLFSVLLPLGVLLGGCATGLDRNYRYHPRPYSAELSAPGDEADGAVRVLAAVAGLRRDPDRGPSVEVTLRIDNETEQPVRFDPGSLQLSSADLQRFPEPETDPKETKAVKPNGSARITARFPFPGGKYPGGYDLGGLNLRYAVQIGERTVRKDVTFQRQREPFYERPYHPYPHSHLHFRRGVYYDHW